MRLPFTILLWLLLIPMDMCKLYQIKDVVDFSLKIIKLTGFVVKLIPDNDGGNVQKSIDDLRKSMKELHSKLDYNIQLTQQIACVVREESHENTIRENIQKIESCKKDLENMFDKPFNIPDREKVKTCINIREYVRGIGKYLTGEDKSRSIYELSCKEHSLHEGQIVENKFNKLYGNYFDGCTVLGVAETMKYDNESTTLRDECWDAIAKINSSKSTYYRKNINRSCSTFHTQTHELLNGLESVNAFTVHEVLQSNLPWFQYTVVESNVPYSTVENKGNFPLKYKFFIVKQKVYHAFWTDSFVSFYKNRSNEKQHFVNVTVSFDDYEDLSFGMNLSEDTSRERKLVSVFGYTSDQSIINCTYSQGPDASTAASSTENLLPTTTLILVVMLFCPAIINMDLRIGMRL